MSVDHTVAVGLDLGTGGARALAVNLSGGVVAGGRADFPADAHRVDGPRVEQDPAAWTRAAGGALRELTARLPSGSQVLGISVDATSGTFLLLDADHRPLTPGIMYNDLRGAAECPRAAEALRDVLQPYGIEIAPAFALPKILHLAASRPDLFGACRRIVHQTDWVVGMLCGRYDVTDISTALKTGADPGRLAWPEALEGRLGIPRRLLGEIVLPGVVLGKVTPRRRRPPACPPGRR
jgi:sugar (pentulose or hexulose) kinase